MWNFIRVALVLGIIFGLWSVLGVFTLLSLILITDVIKATWARGGVKMFVAVVLVLTFWPVLSFGSLIFLYFAKSAILQELNPEPSEKPNEEPDNSLIERPTSSTVQRILDVSPAGTCLKCGEDSLWNLNTPVPEMAGDKLVCTWCDTRVHNKSRRTVSSKEYLAGGPPSAQTLRPIAQTGGGTWQCLGCGRNNPPEMRFCTRCGSPR